MLQGQHSPGSIRDMGGEELRCFSAKTTCRKAMSKSWGSIKWVALMRSSAGDMVKNY